MCEIDFNKPIYDNLSNNCKNLLINMLQKDPCKRIDYK